MSYLYASLSVCDDQAQPQTWVLTVGRDRQTFGIHTSAGYFSFDRDAAESMIRRLEMGLAQLELPERV